VNLVLALNDSVSAPAGWPIICSLASRYGLPPKCFAIAEQLEAQQPWSDLRNAKRPPERRNGCGQCAKRAGWNGWGYGVAIQPDRRGVWIQMLTTQAPSS
jgi:hypothetical protein